MPNIAQSLYDFASRVGADTRETRKKTVDLVRARAHGATGTAGTATTNGVAAARTAAGVNRPILTDSGDFGASQTINPYGVTYKEPRGLGLYMGTPAAPSTTHDPIMSIEKVANTSVGGDRGWDSGAFYASLQKVGGSSYGSAGTFYGHHNGGTADLIGVHSRVRITTDSPEARGWALWGYVVSSNPQKAPFHAAELNGCVDPGGADPEWGGVGQCLRICMSDLTHEGNRMSTAISVGKSTFGGNNGFYTGIDIEPDAVIPTQAVLDNGEAIKLSGPLTGGTIGGIRMRGRLKYAIRTDEAVLANGVSVLMGDGQKLAQWGGLASNRFIGAGTDHILFGASINLDNSGRLRVNNTPVVGPQQPGIPTINAGSTNNDTKNNVINAIITALRAHGLVVPTPTSTS